MKNILTLITILTIISCVEPSTESVHKINNPLNHDLSIKIYLDGLEKKSFLINKNSFYENSSFGTSPTQPYYFEKYDSIIIKFDNSKTTKYINGTSDVNNRNPSNLSNWKIESTTENKRKKRYKTVYEYNFIEQDYLDAR